MQVVSLGVLVEMAYKVFWLASSFAGDGVFVVLIGALFFGVYNTFD